jgi:cyclase
MLKKRIIIILTFVDGILFRTKKFIADYRYTKNFVDMWEADEIVLLDISRKNKLSKSFFEVVNFFCQNCFLPISIGGGIKNIEDARRLFKLGADKIILNSSSLNNIGLISEIKKIYGSQSIIHSLDYKKNILNYDIYVNDGTKKINRELTEWLRILEKSGVGEILLNDIDNDGSLLGYNLDFIKKTSKITKLPLIALGGAGKWEHFSDLFIETNVSAAATQNIFHFTNESLNSLKKYLFEKSIEIRR